MCVHTCMCICVNIMLNKNTYGAKKGEANQKQQLSDYTCDSKFSLTLSLSHLFVVSRIAKRWPSDKVKENFETNLEVHCFMQLSLSYKVFRWHPLNIML